MRYAQYHKEKMNSNFGKDRRFFLTRIITIFLLYSRFEKIIQHMWYSVSFRVGVDELNAKKSLNPFLETS